MRTKIEIRTGATPPGARPAGRRAIVITLSILAVYNVSHIAMWLAGSPQPAFGDFFALWSFGKFAAAAGSKIYDPVALQAFQRSLDPHLSLGGYPCPYPPAFLLLLMPLGWIPIATAYVIWIAATFLCYGMLTLGRDLRWLYGAALLVAPTTLLTVISGQNGFLSAALLVGGLRSLAHAPVLGGVLLGLLAYKPQLTLLVPVALIAAQEWRAIKAACATIVLMIATTATLFGWSIWSAWIQTIPLYWKLLKVNQASLDHLMPTLSASMREIGMPAHVGYLAQFVLITLVVVAVWRAFAKPVTDSAIALAVIGTLLITPYAFIYDMPMITAGLVMEWRRRERSGVSVTLWEFITVGVMFDVTMYMTKATIPFVVPALLSMIFIAIALQNKAQYAMVLASDAISSAPK